VASALSKQKLCQNKNLIKTLLLSTQGLKSQHCW
jgi:hypothetical protein